MMQTSFLFYFLPCIVFCSARSTTFLKQDEENLNLSEKKCEIVISKDLSEPQPLILEPEDEEFLYPDDSGYLSLKADEELRVACPGNKVKYKTFNATDEAILKCIDGNRFSLISGKKIVQKEVALRNITCGNYPSHIVRRRRKIDKNIAEYDIGFLTKSKNFYYLFDILHDISLHHTVMAHGKIVSSIKSAQKSFPRKNFRKDGFFDAIPVYNVYQVNNQQETFSKLLGDNSLSSTYITDKNYLARGHLIGKADFIYGNQQRSTFSFANCVPMWHSINGGNWKIIESNVRNFVIENYIDVDVWTGSLGILTLKDNNNNDQEIYLYADENGNVAVPVPKILFKVVYDEEEKRGVVFLTANNPYLKKLTKDYVVCQDISHKFKHLSWKAKASVSGLSYSCEVDDFRRAFPKLPAFDTEDILLF